MSDADLVTRETEGSNTLIRTSSGPVEVSGIIGWGSDADPRNDPTYPYRDRSQDDHSGEWKRPTLQVPQVEILQSVEHKQLPAVFGESSPPRWVSGMMRRAAFTWSESNWAHWLLLMGADRVNMFEGLVEDLAHGTIPNIPKEMGIRAEWHHNKRGLATKVAIAGTIAAGIYLWSRSREARP
ncbi:hypothetical protein ACUXST_001698 [Sphingomonas sp. F9_3S_D5_B_2]